WVLVGARRGRSDRAERGDARDMHDACAGLDCAQKRARPIDVDAAQSPELAAAVRHDAGEVVDAGASGEHATQIRLACDVPDDDLDAGSVKTGRVGPWTHERAHELTLRHQQVD